MSDDPLLKVNQVAERLQINPATVRAWLKNGRLRGVYMGSDKVGWRIPTSEVERIRTEGVRPISGDAPAGK